MNDYRDGMIAGTILSCLVWLIVLTNLSGSSGKRGMGNE